MRWSSAPASSNNTVNGAGSSRYSVSSSMAASRLGSPSCSMASRSLNTTTWRGASMGTVRACAEDHGEIIFFGGKARDAPIARRGVDARVNNLLTA